MSTQRFYIFLILVLACMAPVAWGQQTSGLGGQKEAIQLLWEKINDARANPLQAAAAIGVSEATLQAEDPEFYDRIKGGMPLLKMSSALTLTATDHTSEMIQDGYFSKDSASGNTFEERLDSAGYLPGTTGESIGILLFSNYMDPVDAAGLLFERLLRKELSTGGTADRNILNPEFQLIGIGFGAGVASLAEGDFNAYFLTCDFGELSDAEVKTEQAYERLLLSLANQVRRKPIQTAASLGMDLDELKDTAPALYTAWMNTLPVLSPAKSMSDLAQEEVVSAVSDLSSGVLSVEAGKSGWVVERVPSTTEVPHAAILLAYRSRNATEGYDPAADMYALIRKLAVMDAFYWGDTTPCLLDPTVNEIGFATAQRLAHPPNEDAAAQVELVALVTGTTSSPESVLIVQAYSDNDGNGLYSPGEEAAKIPLEIFSGSTPVGFARNMPASTGRYGVSVVPAPSGPARIEAAGVSDAGVGFSIGSGQSAWVPLVVPPVLDSGNTGGSGE
jgi:hypothetical protein